MKITTALIALLIIMFACRPAKKVQKTSAIISKVDTAKIAVADANKTADSAIIIKEIYNKVIKNKINFTTFNAKLKLAYSSKEETQDATGYIRVRRDSAIWLSLRGPLGIEGFRILITKDSVKVINMLKKYVQYKSIGFLQEITGIPFDFSALQDLIIGNAVFIDSNIHAYHTDSSNHLQVLMNGTSFKHLITIDNTNYKILHSKLDDINEAINRTCEISYSGYDENSGVPFSTERKISVTNQSKSDINLDFKQFGFNQPVTFPFKVDPNYKRL